MLTLEELAALAIAHEDALRARVREFSIGGRHFEFNARAFIMGVINLSPDSWYRESVVLTPGAAIRRAAVLSAQGADIIDLGAESSLPGAARTDAAGQLVRFLPVIGGMRERGIIASVETYEPEVVRACLEAGANVVNLTGSSPSVESLRQIAEHEAALILCHVQGAHVRAVGDFDLRADPVAAMYESFARQIERVTRCGVTRILLDPGLGFYYGNLKDSAVRVRHQMTVFINSFRLRTLGWPVCHALPHAFEYFGEEVRSAEPFFAFLAALGKTDLFRTHEVPRVRAVLETLRVF
jgi:dihydropteroate synthase